MEIREFAEAYFLNRYLDIEDERIKIHSKKMYEASNAFVEEMQKTA